MSACELSYVPSFWSENIGKGGAFGERGFVDLHVEMNTVMDRARLVKEIKGDVQQGCVMTGRALLLR